MIKKLSFLVVLTWVSISFGQTNNTSPYSYFGIGESNQHATVASSSMGGINTSLNYTSELNFTNPAALHALQFTTFSIAGRLKYLQVDDGSNTQEASYTSLSSLAIGFPIGIKGGLMVGLQPNSNIGYAIEEEILNSDEELIELNTFTGDGGTNRFFGSFAYLVAKGLSVGIEGEYLFGNLDNSITNKRQGVSLYTKYSQVSNITGASLKIGTQYSKKIKNNLSLNFGASVKFENALKAESDTYFFTISPGSSEENPDETETSLEGEITRPLSFQTGTGIGQRNKWYIGVAYETQDALVFDESVFLNNNKVQYSPKSRYSIGGYWLPKRNSITSYWHRVTYRAGIKYEETGLAVNVTGNSGDFTPIDDFGISFGLGLPIGNQLSQINLGLEYGKRGSATAGLIKENYFNLRLDLNLADKWFRKRQIN